MCGAPKVVKNAVPEDSGDIKLRYTCVRDYKRKAGTSSLTVCKENKTTKKFEWTNPNLICIKDPSKPLSEFEHTTEDTRKEAETSTRGRQPAPPKTGTNPAAVSRAPYRNEITSAPDSSTAATQLWTARSSPAQPTAMESTRKTGGGILGPEAEIVTPSKGTATHGSSRPESWNPPSRTFSTEISTTVTVPSRDIPENTTWLSVMDTPQGQTGSLYLKIMFLPIVLILLLLAGLWYLRRKRGRFRSQRVTEEIPMADRAEETGQMIPAGPGTEDVGPADEGMLLRRSHCATSTG